MRVVVRQGFYCIRFVTLQSLHTIFPSTAIPEATPRHQREGPSQPQPAGLRPRGQPEGADEREADVPGQGARGTRSSQFSHVHRVVSQRRCTVDVIVGVERARGVPGRTGAVPERPGTRQHHRFVGTLLFSMFCEHLSSV